MADFAQITSEALRRLYPELEALCERPTAFDALMLRERLKAAVREVSGPNRADELFPSQTMRIRLPRMYG